MVLMSEEELRDLVEDARRGVRDAENRLVRRYARFVERRLARLKRARNWFWLTELEDAVQDVFVQFFKSLRAGKFSFESTSGLEGYLVTTCFFIAMNLKDKRPREKSFSQLGASESDDDDRGVEGLLAFADAVYEKPERKDCLRMLYEAIEELGENRRDIIRRTLEGQKVREICAATARSPASVSGLKFNALKDLRQILAGSGFLESCAEVMELPGGADHD